MKSPMVRSIVMGYLLENVDIEASTITFHGRTFQLTTALFELVMGLRDGGDEVIPHDDAEVNPIRDAIMGGKVRIQVTDLIK